MAGRQPMLSFAKVVKGAASTDPELPQQETSAPQAMTEQPTDAAPAHTAAATHQNEKRPQRRERTDFRKRGDAPAPHRDHVSERADKGEKFQVVGDRNDRSFKKRPRNRENRGFEKKPVKTDEKPEPKHEKTEDAPAAEPIVLTPAPPPAVNAWFKKGQGGYIYHCFGFCCVF